MLSFFLVLNATISTSSCHHSFPPPWFELPRPAVIAPAWIPLAQISLSQQHKHTHTTVHSGTLILPWHHHMWMEALIALLNLRTFNLCLWLSSAHMTKGCMSTQERMSCKNHLSWLLEAGMWNRTCVCVCVYVDTKTKNARHNMWAPCATSHSGREKDKRSKAETESRAKDRKFYLN